ncbi:DNA internalization-related competence protein ComEC/Rec2 [Lysobacter xinjiangensis]|uniref:DNA internalization-related competence protein ComEC/Rec2 n=1 Tax=Cognatilysobacter xinjiangensis TaxID=546892 RepID=A0ABQ3BRY8_9GAMM|nr:DNA internalization-related competence protein ComEC/Rec2 [Lysobacter xinjiangensis]GGZ55676.1 DNA internalization-related competence protein ComEC/Rec2 [Lysobacter xinjiangensis]
MHAARTPLITPLIALALLAGVCACLSLPSVPPLAIALPVAAGGAVLAWRWPSRRWVGALLLGAGLAGLHAIHALVLQLPAHPERQDATLDVRIVDLPRVEPLRTVFEAEVERDPQERLEGRRLRLSWYARGNAAPPILRAGERWRFALRLRAPRGLRNPGAADGEMHAFADRLTALGYVADGERVGPSTGLQGWRDATSLRIERAVDGPSSRFVRALALGDTRGLTDDDWTRLRADGLTHLIAISGFHVGMVASVAALLVRALWWLLPALARRLPARIAMAMAGVGGALVYAAASGFSMPTVRTLLMIAVVALARGTRRSIGMPQALAMAAVPMLLIDPLCVLSAGFWLSFAGVAWLLWCMPLATSPVRDLLRAQGVATVGLLPLTVVLFGQASLAGPVANLVAVPWWSLVVAPLSVAGVALDAVHPVAGAAAWRLAARCFELAWPLFERLADSPLSLWYLPEASGVAVVLALLGAAWCLMPRGTPGRALGVLLWLPLLWPDRHAPADGDAEVTAIDVGQGLSVLVRTRTHSLLYDMGPAVPEGFDAGERAVVPVLHARGVRRLDRMMVSHADLDHIGGLDAVRREIRADALFAPDGAGVQDARPCLAGSSWSWDGVRFRVLHPPPYFPYLANEASCVLRIETRHGAVLLTGDIGEAIEARLVAMQSAALRVDAVFVPHHGSRHSSSQAFVRATGARLAIVSAGHSNRFRHPNRQVVERWQTAGARVIDTADAGAVTLRSGPGGIVASGRREARPRLWDAARRATADAGLSYRRD